MGRRFFECQTRVMAELDGEPANADQLKALALTNYGHFTSMRVEDGKVRGLSLHLERLTRDCMALFGRGLDVERVRAFVRHAIDGRGDAMVVRVSVFDPALQLGHPGDASDPRILVTWRTAVSVPQPPMRVSSVAYERDLPSVKHVGLFGSLHHRRQAQLAGFDDTLFVDGQGRIAEGGTWNVGFYDGDRLVWPEADYLPGVTMALLSQAHDGPTSTLAIQPAELPRGYSVFATNAASGVRAIIAIDDRELASSTSMLDTLRKQYNDLPADPL